jgi:hypothetical protein
VGGERPPTDAKAAHVFHQLYDSFITAGGRLPDVCPDREYVSALLDRWPDVAENGLPSPWVTCPSDGASGSLLYVAVRASRADIAAAAATLAAEFGLACFDPQTGQLR